MSQSILPKIDPTSLYRPIRIVLYTGQSNPCALFNDACTSTHRYAAYTECRSTSKSTAWPYFVESAIGTRSWRCGIY